MSSLQDLSAETFRPLTGQILTLRTVDETAAGTEHRLELTEVRILGGRYPGANRDPFALTFRGPAGMRLPQSIYRFELPDSDPLEFFITQTGDNATSSWFEAIFT